MGRVGRQEGGGWVFFSFFFAVMVLSVFVGLWVELTKQFVVNSPKWCLVFAQTCGLGILREVNWWWWSVLRLKIYVEFIHIYTHTHIYIYIHIYIHIYTYIHIYIYIFFVFFLGDVKMYFYGLRWQVGVVIVLLSGMNVYFRFFLYVGVFLYVLARFFP